MRDRDPEVRLCLLGGFECVAGSRTVNLSLGAQRLLALLALNGTGIHRVVASRHLWPESPPTRAAANLRSALWRGRRIGSTAVIDSSQPRLRLTPHVETDVRVLIERLGERASWDDAERRAVVIRLSRSLLPDWSDDWLTFERERWDQVRLHGLEEIAQQLQEQGDYLAALETAMEAVALEPIRETAHRIVIEVHLAEGNRATALRHYQRYCDLLRRELGVAPFDRMDQLVRPHTWS